MKLVMTLNSDTIFGSGWSIPGEEDISVQHDIEGFPYIKGSTIRGVLREEIENLLSWQGAKSNEAEKLFGLAGFEEKGNREIIVSDFVMNPEVCKIIKAENVDVLDTLTNIRTFTSIEKGTAKTGTLRYARCIQKGLHFYGEIDCAKEDEELVKNAIGLIKWIGTMRTRGFGKIQMEVRGEDK